MTEISEEDVVSVLTDDEAMSKVDIIRAVSEDDVVLFCPECGSERATYRRVREDVDEALMKLMSKSKIVSTPDWNYRLARRA